MSFLSLVSDEEKLPLLPDDTDLIYSIENSIKLLKKATLDTETIKFLERTYDLVKKLKSLELKEKYKMQIRDITKSLKESQLKYKEMIKVDIKDNDDYKNELVDTTNQNINSGNKEFIINIIDENLNDMNENSNIVTMKSVNEEIEDLHGIYKDLSVLVNEQGEIVDRIDYNIEQTLTDVEDGKNQIVVAHKKKKKRRKRIIIIVSIVLIIVLFLVLSIYFDVIKK